MESNGPVYEMLWDCRYCGTTKLLGLTHRHCPQCGAPQNADARYFPEDSEKTPAKEHVYYGADVKCRACGEANSKHCKHCRGCGSPLEDAAEVQKRPEQRGPQPSETVSTRFLAPKQKPNWRRRAIIGGTVASGLGLAVSSVAWTEAGQLEVVNRSWERSIAIERLGAVQESSWCDQMPSGTRNVRRSREERSRRKVEDGQDCVSTKVDLGNGTFTEKEQCSPRYREEPEYDDRCTYDIDRWTVVRSAKVESKGPKDPPRWPSVSLDRTGQCIGCEREGARKQVYSLELSDEKGRIHECDVDENRWAKLSTGTRVLGKIGVMTGSLSCDSLGRSE